MFVYIFHSFWLKAQLSVQLILPKRAVEGKLYLHFKDIPATLILALPTSISYTEKHNGDPSCLHKVLYLGYPTSHTDMKVFSVQTQLMRSFRIKGEISKVLAKWCICWEKMLFWKDWNSVPKQRREKCCKWFFTVKRSASAFPLKDAHNLLKCK